ncbi:MAG: putative dual-specificity RNA methyltransferase RlmN [Nitrospirales bacterium]|nr:MAG: putative dual-specificity RNA methyltransferase RlmN [Nitrospirales bacterium]
MLSNPIQISPSRQLTNLLAMDWPAMCDWVSTLGWPSYRAKQILCWLYQKRILNITEMTDLSLSDRSHLQSIATITRASNVTIRQATDGTKKFLLELTDGLEVESVLIPEDDRLTLCVSTQVGCTLDCDFCLTGQMGLKRNLKAHEIVSQVLTVQDHVASHARLTSLVFMGMGEPLANMEEVSEAIKRLTNGDWGVGFSPRRITVSTAGLASRLGEVAPLGVNLAISLNATTDRQRHELMPAINTLHPLSHLLKACRDYPLKTGRRLTFEYVLLAGVNDSMADAKRIPKLLNGIRCKINLIPFNEFQGSLYKRPSEQSIGQFQMMLRRSGLDVFIRKSRGRDVLGACGQLGDIQVGNRNSKRSSKECGE